MKAAENGHLEIVEKLHKAGANLNITEKASGTFKKSKN